MATNAMRRCLAFLGFFAGALASVRGAGSAGLPAFPGAEGFGCETRGGRGGRVLIVDSLADSGPGSLRAACMARGPRASAEGLFLQFEAPEIEGLCHESTVLNEKPQGRHALIGASHLYVPVLPHCLSSGSIALGLAQK